MDIDLNMNIQIKKLDKNMIDEYIRFFDETPHDDGVPEHTCYCVNWCCENQLDRIPDPQREQRRQLAREYIQKGLLKGYVAMVDGKIVGWCNANTKVDCANCYGWLNYMTEINKLSIDESEKVKAIYCFMIAPWMKRKGVATKLLDFICKDAKQEGFDYVEAYPLKTEDDMYQFYVGHKALYEKLGFETYTETATKVVMRRNLSNITEPIIINADIGSQDARELISELNEKLKEITGNDGSSHFASKQMDDVNSAFLIAYISGVPYGCGAIRQMSENSAEIKRVYARENTCGVGTLIVKALEKKALEYGYNTLYLETRAINTNAIAFYEKNGYVRCPNYGVYEGKDYAVCFTKTLKRY